MGENYGGNYGGKLWGKNWQIDQDSAKLEAKNF